MSEYVNGWNIAINDMSRITFMEDTGQGVAPTVISKIVMQFETLKMLREALGKVIEQHEANLKQLAEKQVEETKSWN